jgi:hypothetical protein
LISGSTYFLTSQKPSTRAMRRLIISGVLRWVAAVAVTLSNRVVVVGCRAGRGV